MVRVNTTKTSYIRENTEPTRFSSSTLTINLSHLNFIPSTWVSHVLSWPCVTPWRSKRIAHTIIKWTFSFEQLCASLQENWKRPNSVATNNERYCSTPSEIESYNIYLAPTHRKHRREYHQQKDNDSRIQHNKTEVTATFPQLWKKKFVISSACAWPECQKKNPPIGGDIIEDPTVPLPVFHTVTRRHLVTANFRTANQPNSITGAPSAHTQPLLWISNSCFANKSFTNWNAPFALVVVFVASQKKKLTFMVPSWTYFTSAISWPQCETSVVLSNWRESHNALALMCDIKCSKYINSNQQFGSEYLDTLSFSNCSANASEYW